jgi:hypothetical protein
MAEGVLVRYCFLRLAANTEWDLFCHAENLSNRTGRHKKKRPSGRSLARKQWMGSDGIAGRLAVIVVLVVVVVPILVMAAVFPHLFEFVAFLFRLTAVFTVLAFGVVQLVFRVADSLFALSVVIAVKGPDGNGPAQERENDKRRNECSGFCEHANLLGAETILLRMRWVQPVPGAGEKASPTHGTSDARS